MWGTTRVFRRLPPAVIGVAPRWGAIRNLKIAALFFPIDISAENLRVTRLYQRRRLLRRLRTAGSQVANFFRDYRKTLPMLPRPC